MTGQHDPDGLTQLAELMRDEHVPEREPVDPVARRRRRMRGGIIAGVVTVAVLGSAGGYAGWALNAPVGAAASSAEAPVVAPGPAAEIALSQDGATAISVAGAEEYLGPDAAGIWMRNGTDGTRPIASLTKLVTALVILDAKPLTADEAGPTITFSEADHDLYDHYYVLGATIAAMPAGSRMSERDALETILIPSASNYADAVATWAFGSRSAFVAAARDWLDEHGLTQTRIVEPTGLDPRNTSSTADLIALGRLAAADPVVSAIVAMPNLAVEGMDAMPNTNDLLGSHGITGLKTGTLAGHGSSLLFTADLEVGLPAPLSVTGVVLAGFSHQSVDADVAALLTSIEEGFHDVAVATAGQEVGTYTTPWGESATMVLATGATLFTWSDTPVEATIETTSLTTGADGEEVGTVTFSAGTATATVPVVLDGSISPPDAWWRLTHPGELG